MPLSTAQSPSTQTASPGSLTLDFLASLREGYTMSEADRACHNAVTNNEVNDLALNREVVRGDDGHFSHRIKSKGITNQKNSGRCWMFAALNILRPQVIRVHGMAEFEFSTAYLQFWDKLERSNLSLEAVIELRKVDYLDREWETVNKNAIEDGGWWNYAAELVEKYGVVPQSVMPETHSSSNTTALNEILGRLLRARAVGMMDRHGEGATVEELRTLKNEALQEAYRFLVINFGVPPTEFEWRYRHTKKSEGKKPDERMQSVAEGDLVPLERHTPRSFYKKYVGSPLSDFVCLYNDPKNPLDRHYSFKRANNIVGNPDMDFVNVDMVPMKEIAAASILANEPLWFAVNMEIDESRKLGLMEHRLFDYEALFGMDLTVSKADRARFHADVSGHAMALMGVDLTEDGKPRKWLAENSWGDEKGEGGRWTLYDKWFDEHVYTIIVHKRHVPAEIMKCFEEEAIELPSWYPGASGTA
jgi:bleomycin hydrolase